MWDIRVILLRRGFGIEEEVWVGGGEVSGEERKGRNSSRGVTTFSQRFDVMLCKNIMEFYPKFGTTLSSSRYQIRPKASSSSFVQINSIIIIIILTFRNTRLMFYIQLSLTFHGALAQFQLRIASKAYYYFSSPKSLADCSF